MHIESNIAGVVDRLERRKQAVPAAVTRALAPNRWLAEARELAHRILAQIAQPREHLYIPGFVRSIMAGVLSDGFFLTMRSPFRATQTLAQFQASGAAVAPADLSQNLFLGQLTELERLVEQWVATEKDKDARDAGKTDAGIANLITWLLVGTHEPGSKAAQAQVKLMPHIADFIQRQQANSRLPVATVNLWMTLVLEGWRELVRMKFPGKLRAELSAGKDRLL